MIATIAGAPVPPAMTIPATTPGVAVASAARAMVIRAAMPGIAVASVARAMVILATMPGVAAASAACAIDRFAPSHVLRTRNGPLRHGSSSDPTEIPT